MLQARNIEEWGKTETQVLQMRGILWPGEDPPLLPEPSYHRAVKEIKDRCLWCGFPDAQHYGAYHACVGQEWHSFTRRGEFKFDGAAWPVPGRR